MAAEKVVPITRALPDHLAPVFAQFPLDVRGASGDEVLALVDEQAQLALRPVEGGNRQIGLAERGPRDGKGIDRVALARLPSRRPDPGHQRGRHPDRGARSP